MKPIKAGMVYFAIVFGVGFVLGPIRLAFVVPRLGERTAELLEAPIILAVALLAARWIIRRYEVPNRAGPRLAMGAIALALMLVAEFGLVLYLRGISIHEYLVDRDVVAAFIYYLALLIFAVIPILAGEQAP